MLNDCDDVGGRKILTTIFALPQLTHVESGTVRNTSPFAPNQMEPNGDRINIEAMATSLVCTGEFSHQPCADGSGNRVQVTAGECSCFEWTPA